MLKALFLLTLAVLAVILPGLMFEVLPWKQPQLAVGLPWKLAVKLQWKWTVRLLALIVGTMFARFGHVGPAGD